MQEYIEKLHVLKIFELKDVVALTGKMRSALVSETLVVCLVRHR
ncbi:MAG TPA: hypothetical protein PLR88_08020 [Bacteroidales bacterium]|nr:hypothetical protein [Bacteroidales bacterium]HPT21875.1 hypothetical protein [Bacteroidales bacterium]